MASMSRRSFRLERIERRRKKAGEAIEAIHRGGESLHSASAAKVKYGSHSDLV